MRRRWRGGQWGGGGGQWERGDRERATGRGRRGGGKGEGKKKGQEERVSQMDMMKCLGGMRLQSFLTLFTRATPGTPASHMIKDMKLLLCSTGQKSHYPPANHHASHL